jgi:Domain of unknown function (DUF4340)
MMRAYRQSLVLIALFFTALLTYWGLQYFGVRSESERRLRAGRVLPNLLETPETSMRKLAIERNGEQMVFERRGNGYQRWQMVKPLDVGAEPGRLKTLVGNLKELRRLPDAGPMTNQEGFGLDPPAATIQIWGGSDAGGESTGDAQLLATLELGKVIRGARYVRPAGSRAVEVVDAKLLRALDDPLTEWRERTLLRVATFEVTELTVKRPDKTIRAARAARSQWKLSEPPAAPANGAKVESLLAAMAAVQVSDGDKGFVADNVRDFTPYGLEPPAATVELMTPGREPLVLDVGKPVPDRPDRIYVRPGGQDDVVMVNAKPLSEIPTSALALRSQQVADIQPSAVSHIEIEQAGSTFSLKKEAGAWRLTRPREERADAASVQAFLSQFESLQTSEFLQPGRIKIAQVDPPIMKVKLWQTEKTGQNLVLNLRVGRHDLARKAVYAQLESDTVILALPDTLMSVLPKNRFAFRDRTITSQNPAQVRKLIVTRGSRIDELEPTKTGAPNQWRMLRPIEAPADVPSVTRVLATLTALRAEDFVSDSPGDAGRYGLDRPLLEVAWTTEDTDVLKVGSRVPGTSSFYAHLERQPYTFTLSLEALAPLEGEFRDHVVCTFPEPRAERVVLRWPNRNVALRRRLAAKGQPPWVDEPGADAAGVDISRASALVGAMAHLETVRYFQYDGPFDAVTGLARPRLVVEVELGGGEPPRVIRLGWPTQDGLIFAAAGTGSSGPVFVLPGPAWEALIQSGQRYDPLPANVFAPAR